MKVTILTFRSNNQTSRRVARAFQDANVTMRKTNVTFFWAGVHRLSFCKTKLPPLYTGDCAQSRRSIRGVPGKAFRNLHGERGIQSDVG